MREETTFIFKAADWLLRKQADWQQDRSKKRKLSTLSELLNSAYPPIQREMLEYHFSSQNKEKNWVDTVETKGFFWLPPLREANALPVLAIMYDGTSENVKLSLKVVLFFIASIEDTEDLKAVGYRFESSSGQQSSHDYYHVQPIKKFCVSGEETIVGCDPYSLDSSPAIPLRAKSVKELLKEMIISLYGSGHENDVLNDLLAKSFYQHSS